MSYSDRSRPKQWEQGPNRLRLIHTADAGFDGIEPEALNSGAVCANTFHPERSIAEYVATVLVVLRRDLMRQDAALWQGKWHSRWFEADNAPYVK